MERHDSLSMLMKEYAEQGFSEWKNVDLELRNKVRRCLENKIVESEGDFRYEISKPHHGKFFPMPKKGYERDVKRCFFRAAENQTFELFIFIDDTNSLAFRFEASEEPGSNHNYAHVQFCRKIKEKQICPAEIPSWIPESYPAFPLPSATDSTKLFLSMTTAVHGRSNGIEIIIRQIFQSLGRSTLTEKYINLLKEMFDHKIIISEDG